MKTTELSGIALDWAVAKCEVAEPVGSFLDGVVPHPDYNNFHPSTDWSRSGPIIEREGISVIQLEDKHVLDEKGYWQGVYAPRWAAVVGDKHRQDTVFSSYGEVSGECYEVDSEAVIGSTPLEAAMRAYVAKRLGNEVEVPGGLK